jgi:hypothetical protein
MCDRPCYVAARSSVATYDFMINIVLPILVITAANISLIVRVVRQKRGHSSSWHRQRKLTIQLLCIAIVYILLWFPMAFNGLFLLFWFSNTCILMQVQADYFLFVLCMVAILLPFISLATLPTLTRTWCNERLRVMMRSSNIAQAPFTRWGQEIIGNPLCKTKCWFDVHIWENSWFVWYSHTTKNIKMKYFLNLLVISYLF